MEGGELLDPFHGSLRRRALSLFGGHSGDGFRWAGSLEFRDDRRDDEETRRSWLARNTVAIALSPDWEALGRMNLAIGEGPAGAWGAGESSYREFVTGLAYRPVRDMRTQALLRYTFLSDEAPAQQLGAGLERNPYAQRSHVLSADGIVRVAGPLSLGGKVGLRTGEIRDRRTDGPTWIGSRALLLVGRGDLALAGGWDLLGEYRRMTVSEIESSRDGLLFGLYRRINAHLRLGAGYNFTDYSDDLTDLSYRNRGFFVNLLGAF